MCIIHSSVMSMISYTVKFFCGSKSPEGNQQQFRQTSLIPRLEDIEKARISGMRSKGDKSFAAGRKNSRGREIPFPLPCVTLRVGKGKTTAIFRQLKTHKP